MAMTGVTTPEETVNALKNIKLGKNKNNLYCLCRIIDGKILVVHSGKDDKDEKTDTDEKKEEPKKKTSKKFLGFKKREEYIELWKKMVAVTLDRMENSDKLDDCENKWLPHYLCTVHYYIKDNDDKLYSKPAMILCSFDKVTHRNDKFQPAASLNSFRDACDGFMAFSLNSAASLESLEEWDSHFK